MVPTLPRRLSAAWAFAALAWGFALLGGGCGAERETLTLNLGDGVTMKLVRIPAGRFMMGSPPDEVGRIGQNFEGPQCEVVISRPFYMGIYEVTQRQFEQVMEANPSEDKGPDYPVDKVTMEEVNEFCRKVSAITRRTVRMPTDAEWEYACRAGTQTRYYYGDDPDYSKIGDYAWYGGNLECGADGMPITRLHAVGQKIPNRWGLYDMMGNVYEFCSDYFDKVDAKSPKVDPKGPAEGTAEGMWDGYGMVTRGGSSFDPPANCRSAFRYPNGAEDRWIVGFRVVVEDVPASHRQGG